ncbi:MAG: YgiQ family radical SAM protein, partial [Anaerovoracaceae bacterium]
IGRLLERYGYKVAVLPQPDYKSAEDFQRFGRPRLGFLINSGVVDSMVNNYSVFKHRRKTDEYAPGGRSGNRPDRAVIVYANRAKEAYRDVPVIIGGIEASLRRLGHYDYWSDKVRRSILLDSKADLLIYGMGERAVIEIAEALDSGIAARDITWVRGTCYRAKDLAIAEGAGEGSLKILPSFDEISADKEAYARSFALQFKNNDSISAVALAEKYTDTVYVIQNPPQPPLEREELDDVYALPFENEWHPMYNEMGGIPAFKEIKFSVVSSRGCFGGCSFCALTYHQGRQVRSRSKESIVAEVKQLTEKKDFKGYIHDVGGPTANFRQPACKKQLKSGVCTHKDCLYPAVCSNMEVDHSDYLNLLRAVRQVKGVKKVFIRSGIRYDYLMADPRCDAFIDELCRYHVSGTLKVAPEHISDRVLYYMRKPSAKVFLEFDKKYKQANKRLGKKQYLIPYLISSHPGSTLEDAVEMALFLKEYGFVPDQVQDFYPTPGTLSTCMYYTEMDPLTMQPVYVAKNMEEKRMQRALIHYNKKENKDLVMKALKKAGKVDLARHLLYNTK